MRILIAEDNDALRESMARLVGSWDHETTVVADGRAALHAIRQERWDLVLTDLRMPGADGLEVVGALQQRDSLAESVILTGWSSVEGAVQAMRAGALDYLAKPVNADQLRKMLERVAERRLVRLDQAEAGPGALTDPLTGVANYRCLHQTLDAMLAQDGPAELALAIIDLDNFRLLNDTLGHQRCDEILRQVAQTIAQGAHETDIVGRLGSDDFLVIVPGAGSGRASATVERTREAVARIEVQGVSGLAIPITVSAGIGTTSSEGRQKPELLRAVELAQQEAHRGGGNTVRLRDPQGDSPPPISVRSFSALHGLVTALDARDRYTRLHSEQATSQALRVARSVGCSAAEIREIEVPGPIHDLGKLVIPDSILRKPGPLTSDEWQQMRSHSQIGAIIAASLPDFQPMVGIVRHHHERWDGGGYPAGQREMETDRVVRIFSLGDAFSAMVTDRPYRKALALDRALEEIRSNAGSQFDPDVAQAFLDLDWEAHHLALTA